MKKITLLLCALLLTAGVTKAGEYVAFQPSAPVAISWDNSSWAGQELNFQDRNDISFPTLSEDDKVKIHITNIANGYDVRIKFKVGEGWNWADVPDVTKDIKNGEISFTIKGGSVNYTVKNEETNLNEEKNLEFSAEDMAEWIKDRGLVITGIRYKVLDITVQSGNVADNGSYTKTLEEENNTGSWSSTEIINKDEFKNYTSGDYITATVSLNAKAQEGHANFYLSRPDGEGGWKELEEWKVEVNSEKTEKEVTIYITDDELAAIKTYGLALNGQNTTVTDIKYHYTPAKAGYRPVYIPASRYATFYGTSTCALPDGVSAYYVSSVDNSNSKAITAALSNIPANQGVILEGDEGIYQLYATTDAAADVTANLLAGAVTRTQITDASNKYVLFNNSGTPEFRTITANTYLDPFKAYLNAASSEARIALSFDNETNGIDELKQQTAGSKQMFDLQGRRVAKSTHGLYIVNGKKVFVK